MRERVEDLGRLCVMIEKLLKSDFFNLIPCRDKEFVDTFLEMEEEKREDLLHSIAYGISGVRDELYDMLCISKATDLLNMGDY